ncbi:leucyl/phenylalanyl-tRNA--protein transferase [Pseudoalteromonas sp. T1lg65]|uniref:leucyl/phenylalanyl-tRNA--protein transferase n=1 Tax=Pseudoalteromonas sp. T1lg65 TaxID=2077101 RepID=UPI003F791372
MTRPPFYLRPDMVEFPPTRLALNEPDGLLAYGGDLTIEWLENAYANGIFPWFNEDEMILWWSPSQRGILELSDFHCGRTLRKSKKRFNPKVTINKAFRQVIRACMLQRKFNEGTWINSRMVQAYIDAHHHGIAHSVEVWSDNTLIGGLYGIMQSGVFCGESMFNNQPDGAKLAMWALVNWLKKHNASFIDCQLENPFLLSLGLKVVPREEFLSRLNLARQFTVPLSMWQAQELENIYD